MILFPKHNAAFVHFPKTGGRFIENLFCNRLKIPHQHIGNRHDPWSFHKDNVHQPFIVQRPKKDVIRSYIECKLNDGGDFSLDEPHIPYHPFWYVAEQLKAGNTVNSGYLDFLYWQYYEKDMDNAIVIQYSDFHEHLSVLLRTVFKVNINKSELEKMGKIK